MADDSPSIADKIEALRITVDEVERNVIRANQNREDKIEALQAAVDEYELDEYELVEEFESALRIRLQELGQAAVREDRESRARRSNRILTFPDGTDLKLSDAQGAAVRIASGFAEGKFHISELIAALQEAGEIPHTHSAKLSDIFKGKTKEREALFESLGGGYYQLKQRFR